MTASLRFPCYSGPAEMMQVCNNLAGYRGAVAEDDAVRAARDQAAQMYAADVASRSLGIEISGVAPGRATATMTVTAAMVNGHGIAHGGYVFLLADTAFAFAC